MFYYFQVFNFTLALNEFNCSLRKMNEKTLSTAYNRKIWHQIKFNILSTLLINQLIYNLEHFTVFRVVFDWSFLLLLLNYYYYYSILLSFTFFLKIFILVSFTFGKANCFCAFCFTLLWKANTSLLKILSSNAILDNE